jgi:putative acetyltransferase
MSVTPANLEIRNSTANDYGEILSLYPQAFPDEDLLPLVDALLKDEPVALSLVAATDRHILGHVIFTRCSASSNGVAVSLLGPLAVAPASQRQGVGSALVRAGFARVQEENASMVCVLGDPRYYQRFGFAPEYSLKPPYPPPPEWSDAWQSVSLERGQKLDEGMLIVPAPWQDPALWGP